ncbi:hypothetical protein NKDENANG_00630 [Candidatus Entotheonellaceae bacterium PAL068K]
MFEKAQIDALFADLENEWRDKPEFEQLSRDAHLGIALSDAGRPLNNIDSRIVSLIDKHKSAGYMPSPPEDAVQGFQPD